jgi:transcriptional regulator with GAF, ATPase, and Fis domain
LNLPTAGVGVPAATHDEQPSAPRLLNAEELRELERHNLVAVLRETHWKIAGKGGAAAFLGMHPATLASRLKSMGIERPR